MSQRRLPSGQGPARAGARPLRSSGPRPAGVRGGARRLAERAERARWPEPNASRPLASHLWKPAKGDGYQVEREARGRMNGIRRAAGPARRIRAPRTPRRVSGRAAALGLLLVAFTLAYAYPVQTYLAQQAQIDRMQADQQAQRERIRLLSERLERWDDPEFVASQARSRLQWVREGELLYVVTEDPALTQGNPAPSADRAWFDELWGNVQAADNVTVAP